jgi:hypothetical protein
MVLNQYQLKDDVLDDYLDEGYRKVFGRAKWPFALRQSSVVPVLGIIELPEDASSVKAVFVGDQQGREVQIDRMFEMLMFRPETDIQYWAFSAPNEIMLYPIRRTGSAARVVYYALPAFTTEIPWASEFHSVLADWVMFRAWEAEENPERSQASRAQFESTMSEMFGYYQLSSVAEPTGVVSVQGGKG